MQNTTENQGKNAFAPSSPSRPNERGGIAVTETLLIFDPETAEKLVEKDRNAN